ncbi:MAG: hypothetical protein O3A47_06835 [Chloroflexi bacterium]|nr:hypothetical protein [Chloroflexota bacterium]
MSDFAASIDRIERECRYLRALGGGAPPDPAPVPEPDPPPSTGQKVYYWNGSHPASTFGHPGEKSMSRIGKNNVRTYYEAEQGLFRNPAQFRADALRAQDDGCTAWVWDIEIGALFGLTPSQAQAGIEEVVKVLPCGLAPKIGFEHFMGWRGKVTWGMNSTAALAWCMDSGVSILADWQYSVPGSTFVGVFDNRKARGFTGTQIAVMEPLRDQRIEPEGWKGYRRASPADVRAVHAAGYNQGWFAPPQHNGVTIDYSGSEGMKEARRLYG